MSATSQTTGQPDPSTDDATTALDINSFDDMDYDPPIPYDYRSKWEDCAEEWALEEAKNLIAIHEGGPDFYENLDASVVERWLFSDHEELIDALESQQSLSSFRASLAHFCARMTAAGAYSQTLLEDRKIPTRANIMATFPELTYPRLAEIDRRWNAQLPLEVATLYDRQRRTSFANRFDSDRIAAHSRLEPHSWRRVDLGKVRRNGGGNGYILDSKFWPTELHNPTHEEVILALPAPAGITELSLASWASCDHVHRKSSDGRLETLVEFAGGYFQLPLLRHEEFFRLLRSRLVVLFVFDEHLLLAEYKWNLMEFGPDRFDRLRQDEIDGRPHGKPLFRRARFPADGLCIEQMHVLPIADITIPRQRAPESAP